MKLTFYILFILFFSISLEAQVLVVVNSSVPNDSLTADKLIEIFTLNKNNWEDGDRITVVDQKGSGKSKQMFYEVIDLDQNSVKKIRLKKLFTGSAKPPKTVSTDNEVLDIVSKTPGAVGYIDKKSLDTTLSNIKIVAILDL